MTTIRIALLQLNCGRTPEENLHQGLERIKEAASAGAHVVCLPELFRTRYFCQREKHDYFDFAEGIPGPTTEAVGEIARQHRLVAIVPVFEHRAPGVYHNSAAIVGTDGAILGIYRKMHIPDDPAYYEKFYFTPGDLGFRAFNTPFGRISVLICWDQWFPEAARLCTLSAPTILFYPTSVGWHAHEKAPYGAQQLQAWRTIQRSHAIANGIYVAAVNRVGFEAPDDGAPPIEFWGSSFVADPMGTVISEASVEEETVLLADIDHKRVDTVRRHWPFLRDRRIDAYEGLQHRLLDSVEPTRISVDSSREKELIPGSTESLSRELSVISAHPSPRASGYTMPAEWEPHSATWIAWPHNAADWPGKFDPIPWVYGEIVRHLSYCETVRILVNSRRHEDDARRILALVAAEDSRLEFFHVPTDRAWTRDYGPIWIRRAGTSAAVAIVRFAFRAWAKYSNWKLDDGVAARVASELEIPLFLAHANGSPFVLEGGSIDVNGAGSLITTEECLLDPEVQVRNPGLTKKDTEIAIRESLGVQNILWLGRGIVGDDTHGHVDDICRFVNPRTVVLARETRSTDPNYAILEENRERLQGMRLEDGGALDIVDLPMPSPLFFERRRLPASYANFYILNDLLLVPTFNDPRDRDALGILQDLFGGRAVVGIHAVDLLWGMGTLHCMTQQQPRLNAHAGE